VGILLLGLWSAPVKAAAPANDNFANAQVVSGSSVNVTGTNVEATAQTGEPNHYSYHVARRSVWYKWVAPSTASFGISTSGSSFDTLLAVYTGSSLTALTKIGSNDDEYNSYNDKTSVFTFPATSGVTYLIAVDGSNSATGSIGLHIERPPSAPPAPIIGSRTGTSLSGTTPVLPSGATSLTLVAQGPASTTYSLKGLAGSSPFTIERLKPGTNFTCYYKSVNSGGTIDGPSITATTGPLPPTPDQATSNSVRLTAPTLATGTNWSLQRGVGTVTLPSPPTGNLMLWLKADAVTGSGPMGLSSWNDSSGNNNNAYQGITSDRPLWIPNALNGRPAVNFDGVSDFLFLPSGFNNFSTGMSTFIVARPSAARRYARFYEVGAPQGQNRIVFYRQSGPGDSGTGFSYAAGVATTSADNVLALNQWQTLEVLHAADRSVALLKDGIRQGISILDLPQNVNRSSNLIGKTAYGDEDLYQGDIAEILLYNTALSASQLSSVENYLAAKYGTPVSTSPAGLTWTTIATNQVTGSTFTDGGRNSAQTYWYRYAGASVNGVASSATTAPGVPGVPTFNSVASSSLNVIAPILPTGAGSLILQRKGPADADFGYNVPNISGSAVTPVYGLTASTTYQFRFIAVGSATGTPGAVASAMTIAATAGAPGVPTFLDLTSTSVTVRAPALPLDAARMILLARTSAQVESAFAVVNDATTGVAADALASNAVTLVNRVIGKPLNPSTTYVFRYVAVTPGGVQTPGQAADVTIPETEKAASPPALPSFSNLTVTGVAVTAPALPYGATSLSLQVRPESTGTYSTVATALAPGSRTSVTYPTGDRNHFFRFIAVGTQGSQFGGERAPTTIPEAPVLVAGSVTGGSASFNAPSKTGTNWDELAVSVFVLQKKTTGESDATYTDCNVGTFGANTTLTANQLTPGTSYTFRWTIADNGGVDGTGGVGGRAYGAGTSVTTSAGTVLLPNSPGAPQSVTIIDPFTVDVKAPPAPLPGNADYLKLQIQPVNQGMTEWLDILDEGDNPLAVDTDEVTRISGLTPGGTYRFRYGAVGAGGITYGPQSVDATLPTTSAIWAGTGASSTGRTATTIQCRGIRYPNPAGGTVTVARGGQLRLSSYLATDWDLRTVQAAGYAFSYVLSDPCVYFWNATAGGFQSGVNRAQNAVWIAPSTPGTYSITLVVSDQEGTNKNAAEAGTRDDDNRGTWDAPLTFQLTVNVP
jgi:hypothetical protein